MCDATVKTVQEAARERIAEDEREENGGDEDEQWTGMDVAEAENQSSQKIGAGRDGLVASQTDSRASRSFPHCPPL